MNEIIKIIVTFNAKEFLIELENNNFDVFDSFIKILTEKTGEQNILNDFELIPVNTNISYILIDENNFQNIIDEEIKNENLKIFMNKKEKNEEEENDEDIIFNNNKNKSIKKNNDNEEDFSDNEEEIINNKENIIINNEIKENENDEDDLIENLNIKDEINIKKELDNIFEKENKDKNEISNKIKEKEKDEPILDLKRKQTMPNQILIGNLFNKDNSPKKREKEKKSKNIFEKEL